MSRPVFLVQQTIDPARAREDHVLPLVELVKASVNGDGLAGVRWLSGHAILKEGRYYSIVEALSADDVQQAIRGMPGVTSVDRIYQVNHGNVLEAFRGLGVE
jgi:hypothetical protein